MKKCIFTFLAFSDHLFAINHCLIFRDAKKRDSCHQKTLQNLTVLTLLGDHLGRLKVVRLQVWNLSLYF